jgi:hypothetical protein
VRPIVLILGALALPACKPTCEQVCDKLVACDTLGTDRQTGAECTESCQDQAQLYQRWSDTELRADFEAQLDCLDASTCDEIADGACYVADLYSWSVE